MKNWKILINSVVVGACLVYLSSCDGGGETTISDPSITLSGTDFTQTTFEPEEMIDLTLTFTAPQGISGINWQFFDDAGNTVGSKEFNNPDTDPDLDDITSADTQGSVDLSIPVPTGTQGQNLTLTFEVVDKSSANNATTSFSFSVDAGIEMYETVLLGGYSNSTQGSFYNAVEDMVYKYQEASNNDEKVDFLYYYAETPLNTIASPDNNEAQLSWASQQSTLTWPLTVENSTRFKSLASGFNFEEVTTSTQIENSYPETGDDLERITNLQVGQKVAFMLGASRGARYGVFEVAAIAGTSGSDRAITLNVKIQSNDN